ncbi:MAG: AmmeMemoRadiSam system radical SAM enzyme [bacterium]
MRRSSQGGTGTLEDRLDALSAPGDLYVEEEGDRVRCYACAHRCLVPPGHRGICKVRYNREGVLYVPRGYTSALHADPIEKKPFFHALPGSLALSFGMMGCDYHCSFCQNWVTSQALRDEAAESPVREISPERIVAMAFESGARIVTSTYNEPLITAEWAAEVFRVAKEEGLRTAFVSNGNATPGVLEYLDPHLDLYKVDLKAFTDEAYRRLGGKLEPVLETIRRLAAMDVWLEVVTLLIPGMNDSDTEIRELTGFLAEVSPDIPWHVTAFHPDYRMQDPPATTIAGLRHAASIGRESGLRFVYAGNLPGGAGEWEDTHCPSCGFRLVERSGFRIREDRTRGGRCPDCGAAVPGVWS